MDSEIKISTYFDTPDRRPIDEILVDRINFDDHKLSSEILEAFPELVLIINETRQIVKCNKAALKALDAVNEKEVMGKRFGEAIKCQHVNEMPGGCGTAKSCRECGAAKAIKITNETRTECDDECRITSLDLDEEKHHNFHVFTKPIEVNGKLFTIVSIKDISNQKRREALERIFFHDILNTSSAIQSIATLLPEVNNDRDRNELTNALVSSSNQLINELNAQRELRDAESGNLILSLGITSANTILETAFVFYKNHKIADGKILDCQKLNQDFYFTTDSSILVRSIGNLLKNAFEASQKNDTVTLSVKQTDSEIIFLIHNNYYIHENIQLQIFQRSFSTKGGTGRGIGTYSVKLLVGQYLKGKVDFTSDQDSGTVFQIKIPKFANL